MSEQWLGQTLPEVTLKSSNGGNIFLPKDIKGSWTVLYFYPQDDTPGCTKQACTYRDIISEFKEIGAQVFGISSDDLDSHNAFIKKFSLNFPLLSDTEHALSGPLGVYGDQEWKGEIYKGLSRDTFLIDPQGVIRAVWRKVSPEKSVEDSLNEIKKMIS